MANERFEAVIAALKEARRKPRSLAERRAEMDQNAARVRPTASYSSKGSRRPSLSSPEIRPVAA